METVDNANALVTTRADVVAGFRWQAEEKARRSNDYSDVADYFEQRAKTIQSVEEVFADPRLRVFFIGACALSAKAAGQLGEQACRDIVTATIDFDRLTDQDYVSNLRSRYFLTCGDALGGTMRNVIGKRAQKILSDYVCDYLNGQNLNPSIVRNTQDKITEIRWANRTLVFDRKPKFIGFNIDLILIKSTHFSKDFLEVPSRILACGELKGGIDPAGADEHWKTAKSALDRIRQSYEAITAPGPALFFVGAAIEVAMAGEIYRDIANNKIAAAANLHHINQMTELTRILTET